MKDFTLAEIAKACNGEYVGDESLKNTKITSVERRKNLYKRNALCRSFTKVQNPQNTRQSQ